jgi:hypothetical protein
VQPARVGHEHTFLSLGRLFLTMEAGFCEELCRNLKESEPNWPDFAPPFVEIVAFEGV